MKSRLYAFLAGLAVVLVLGCGPAPADQSQPMGPMEVVKNITQAKGRVVVLNFWASWCAPCRAEIPELIKLRDAFSQDELYLLGVSVDNDPAMYGRFVDKAGFNYPVRRASDKTVEMFQVSGVPKLMVYDTAGTLVLAHEGLVEGSALDRLVRGLLENR